MLIQNEAMGAATASGGERAPIASFWVRIKTACISIKRGVFQWACVPVRSFPFEPMSLFSMYLCNEGNKIKK